MFKGGIGHVEAILSFLLFIGFISTALFFFVPSGEEQVLDSTLSATINSILANTTVDFESYSIKILKSNMPRGQDTIAINFPPATAYIDPVYKVRAETYQGITIPATRVGDTIYVQSGNEQFVTLKFSEDIQPGPNANTRPAENQAYYQISSSSKRKIVSEQRIVYLNNSYYNNYEELKSGLGIPSSISFGFSFAMPKLVIVGEKNIPSGLEVFSSLSRRELLMQKDGVLVFGEVSVKVW